MRTVHETEALRPSDPIPKSMQPLHKSSKIKINLKTPQTMAAHLQGTTASRNGTPIAEDSAVLSSSSSFPADLGFTAEEEAMGLEALWSLLRRQIHWAEEDSEALKREVEVMEEIRKKEWKEKEVLLEQVIKNEIDWHERRQEVLGKQGLARIQTAEEIRAAASEAARAKLLAETSQSEPTIVEDEPQEVPLKVDTSVAAA